MIYLAAPLFNQRERDYNVRLKQLISEKYSVYLPQEDGGLLVDLVRQGMPLDNAVRQVHENDIKALCRSAGLIAVLDGPHVDSGVAFEVGYARAVNKPVIGLHTDSRSELPFGHNPMIVGALSALVVDEVDLLSVIGRVIGA